MEELKNLVKEKAGISAEQASVAIETVLTYMKDRLPKVVHPQLDKIAAGQSLEESIRGKVEEIGSEVRERTEELAKDLKDAFDGAFRSRKDQS